MSYTAKYSPYPSKKYEYKGQSMSFYQWADAFNMKPSTLYTRLLKGWSMERALNEPVGKAPYPRQIIGPKRITLEQIKQHYDDRGRFVEMLKREEVQGLSEHRPRKPHPREKEKEFNYTEKQMQKLATFGMITCSGCQRPNAEENNSCTYCGAEFRVSLKHKPGGLMKYYVSTWPAEWRNKVTKKR